MGDQDHETVLEVYIAGGEKGQKGGDAGKRGEGGVGGLNGMSYLIDERDTYTDNKAGNGKSGKDGEFGVEGLGGYNGNVAINTHLFETKSQPVYRGYMGYIYAIYEKIEFDAYLTELKFFPYDLQYFSWQKMEFPWAKNKPLKSGEYYALNGNYSDWNIKIHDRTFKLKELLYLEKSPPRSLNGKIPNKKNARKKVNPKRLSIEFYTIKTEYYKFFLEQKNDLKFYKLLDDKFISQVFEENHFKPNLENLIERVELLIRFEDTKLLQNFQKEILNYEAENKNEEEKNIIKFLYATVASTIYRLYTAKETDLVVDIKSFIDSNLAIINNWKSLTIQMITENIRNNIANQYSNKLKSKIKEATNLLSELEKSVDDMEENVLTAFENTLKNIDSKKAEANSQTLQLMNETDRIMRNSYYEFNIFSFLKGALRVTAYLVPKAYFFAGVGSLTLEFIEDSILEAKNKEKKLIQSKIDKKGLDPLKPDEIVSYGVIGIDFFSTKH
jgi:hypothetical protein